MDKSLADRVLALVASDDYQPLTPRAISRRLKLDPDELVSLKAAIKTLIKQGAVARNTNKTIEAVKGPAHNREATTLVGTFKRNARGFGFVRPLKESGRHADIYIGPDDGLDASSGDEVAVKLVRNQKGRAPSKGPAGRIVRVVERASAQFVGTYFEESDAGFVRVDGTTFHEPLYVGDPGAKGAKPGDKVAIEIVRYPSPGLEGEGVITEVLGPRGQPGVDTLSIIRAYGLADEFDEDVLEDAREQARRFDETVLADRLDLRGTTTVTIDPATARDFDDAISLDRDEQGHWQLSVHIADVSHFVKPGSPLDRTARQRATSVYLPDRVLPMLPEVLSNALASLQEGRVRYTMTAILDFSPEGICTRPAIRAHGDRGAITGSPMKHAYDGHEGPAGRACRASRPKCARSAGSHARAGHDPAGAAVQPRGAGTGDAGGRGGPRRRRARSWAPIWPTTTRATR